MIDLKSLAGHRYRITLDESANLDTDRESRLWYYRIPCKHGFISVHGPGLLAAYTDRTRMMAKLAALPDVRVHQQGDRELRVLFEPDQLDAVADLLKARRRVHLSPEERQRRKDLIQRVGRNHVKTASPAAPVES